MGILYYSQYLICVQNFVKIILMDTKREHIV